MFQVSEAEVVARAVQAYAREHPPAERPGLDPWEPVAVYAQYAEHRVEGLYLPATRRLTVTSGPVAGTRYKTPSGAARAVVAAFNPSRASTTNGWRFWRVVDTDERLEVLR
ncbi:MAG TPA: hypothetical protein VF519_03730 [Mycobacteriales bacterium]